MTQRLRHLAIIMDGNNRWAKQRRLPGISGHKAGIERLRDMLDGCLQHNIEVLTVFAFSSENWRRPPREVRALMSLFYDYLTRESKKLQKENIRLRVIGNRSRFDAKLLKTIEQAEALTADGERTLVIAADYGGQWDIVNTTQRIARQVADGQLSVDEIDAAIVNHNTSLSEFPAVDCLVRTGGEYRISNFLLWPIAYAELYFSSLLWPDFDGEALNQVVAEFARRQRRFGMTSAQLAATAAVDQDRA
ncbi:MAG: di-trans,poly-cis-decaprenylcistransferase [Cellvibrionaceae bacterium]|nr:di-trans,poly-cis-decaprenylcistransferase [Cellvibrionaceae bacterium]